MLAIVLAVILQQAAPPTAPPHQVVWEEPPPPPPPSIPTEIPAIPDSARADPYGYERAECSPLIRSAAETLEACQARVRVALASNLGDALPPGLRPADAPDPCRQEATGEGYALQCGARERSAAVVVSPQDQVCGSRPTARPGGGVVWTEECRPANGGAPEREGLRFRLGGKD